VISRRSTLATFAILALSAPLFAQPPAKPRPRAVTITYKAKGGGLAKSTSGRWTPGTSVAIPGSASGFASVVPVMLPGGGGKTCVSFNCFDAAGKLVISTQRSFCADSAGNIGNGKFDINAEATGLAQGLGIGIMQFSVGP
jgi:hypothetical protein